MEAKRTAAAPVADDAKWLRDKQHVVRRGAEEAARDDTCGQLVLRRLRQGPATTIELTEVAGHRFSCGIHQLTSREGYIIDRSQHDGGGWLYTLRGQRDLVPVTESMKQAYYHTEHWLKLRARRIEFDKYRCCRCRDGRPLVVHHWVYDLFAEDLGDLETYCAECHDWLHSLNGVRVTFPKLVTQEVALRLKGE